MQSPDLSFLPEDRPALTKAQRRLKSSHIRVLNTLQMASTSANDITAYSEKSQIHRPSPQYQMKLPLHFRSADPNWATNASCQPNILHPKTSSNAVFSFYLPGPRTVNYGPHSPHSKHNTQTSNCCPIPAVWNNFMNSKTTWSLPPMIPQPSPLVQGSVNPTHSKMSAPGPVKSYPLASPSSFSWISCYTQLTFAIH